MAAVWITLRTTRSQLWFTSATSTSLICLSGPSSNTGIGQEEQLARQGYNLIHWTQAGMTYWLISELNLPELKECAQLLKQ